MLTAARATAYPGVSYLKESQSMTDYSWLKTKDSVLTALRQRRQVITVSHENVLDVR